MPAAVKFSKTTTARICKQYKSGKSMGDIGKKLGHSITSIRRVLTEAKVKVRGPGRRKGTKNKRKSRR